MQGSVDEQTLNTTARICDRDAAIMDEPPPIPWNCGPVIEYSGNHPDARDRDWAFTVDLLNKPVVFSLETPEDVNDGDIPISAVLRGWDTVAARQPLDAGWKVLREFDQNIFSGCGIAERLAVLRMMRLMSNVRVPMSHLWLNTSARVLTDLITVPDHGRTSSRVACLHAQTVGYNLLVHNIHMVR